MREHTIWGRIDKYQIWQSNPAYDISYQDLVTQHAAPLPTDEDGGAPHGYSSVWVCTNQMGNDFYNEQIVIDYQEITLTQNGEVVAKIEPLKNGELLITSIHTGQKSHLMITRDRCHIISKNGSIWQRRRRFKEE